MRRTSASKTQTRINAALDLIEASDDPLKVRHAVIYAVGYIDALHDEQLISVDGAQIYRTDAFERRDAKLASLGIVLTGDRLRPL